jgi:15-cis-phytoene synthase
MTDTNSLHLQAQAVMQHHAKSFSWAARFLSPATRRDVRLLYAFARAADDWADEPSLGPLPERLAALRQMGLAFNEPLRASQGDLALAVKTMLDGYGVDAAITLHFLNSIEADAGPCHVADESQLLEFAFGVAGTVGLMLRPLLGAPAAANAHAMALGIAMQLTNIARDVVEDAQRGRCYIPASYGVRPQTLAAPRNDVERARAFAAIARLLELAECIYDFAQSGVDQIAPENRRAIRVALVLYRGIGREILRRGPERYWQGRVHVNAWQKFGLIAKAWAPAPQAKPVTVRAVVDSAWLTRHVASVAQLSL